MNNRYNNQKNVLNSSLYYKQVLEEKNLKTIKHKNVYNFEILKQNLSSNGISSIKYIWKNGDKIYNISNMFYKDPNYGWLILFSNGLSSEFDIKVGNIIKIYFPLNNIIKDI